MLVLHNGLDSGTLNPFLNLNGEDAGFTVRKECGFGVNDAEQRDSWVRHVRDEVLVSVRRRLTGNRVEAEAVDVNGAFSDGARLADEEDDCEIGERDVSSTAVNTDDGGEADSARAALDSGGVMDVPSRIAAVRLGLTTLAVGEAE